MIKFLLRLSVPSVAVLLGAYLLPGVFVQSFGAAIIIALLIGFLNAFVKPILEILTIPITIITLGLFLIILDALMVLVAAKLINGFSVENILWAILFGFIVSVISSILNSILN
ncbi:MAG: phage holin family protein [Bacteroidetes bacterium]|nr:phage holin family protein [Bacteroidota bacterium]